ncbi:MAG TPA: hypothetical protein DIW54_11520 [Chitinophagaceae bacterium]|nr:hypothetical protein [Chitinophagaceae bacterium]HCT23909.1 hypothetical protein [Chitinophagaceae bacterium]
MKKLLVLASTCLLILSGCAGEEKPTSAETMSPATTDSAAAETARFTPAMVYNKKDPSCGMPVTAGISDTAHYKGKVYGFCAEGCKQDFLAHADEMVTQIEKENKEQ